MPDKSRSPEQPPIIWPEDEKISISDFTDEELERAATQLADEVPKNEAITERMIREKILYNRKIKQISKNIHARNTEKQGPQYEK